MPSPALIRILDAAGEMRDTADDDRRELFETIAVEATALSDALELMLVALDRHDAWCGHNVSAPGDSIWFRAKEAAEKALSGTADEEADD